jgi:amino acid adenylation domain-containing protein
MPHRRAYMYIGDTEADLTSTSFLSLDQDARAVGAHLQEAGCAGERVLLAFPPGIPYISAFFGCLFGGAAAVPVYPPSSSRHNRTSTRFQAIAADCQPTAVLTTVQLRDVVQRLFPRTHVIATDDVRPGDASRWREPDISASTLALLQYTSGSTSTPKGVMVSHENLLYNQRSIQALCHHDENSTFVGWLPLYHDMGLIGNIMQPLFIGAECILMSPAAFLQRPLRWLSAISRYRAHTSGGPNFAYDLCVRKITEDERCTLDLSSWRVAFNGAEPVRAESLAAFARTFAGCGFHARAFFPCYGLAENTLIVSGGWWGGEPEPANGRKPSNGHASQSKSASVSCGRPALEQRVAIADQETLLPCPEGRVGEIWVSGSSVATGYWNQEEETLRTFQAYTRDGRGPFLRTGDLGFVREGNLFVTGRVKDLIIVRGRNCYPHDLELTAEQTGLVRPGCSAAFSLDGDGEERVAIACEVDRIQATDVEIAIESIRRAIAEEHEVQVAVVILLRKGGCPKTTSGKVQRSLCRRLFLDGALAEAGRSITANGAGSRGAVVQSPLSALRRMIAELLHVDEEQIRPQTVLTALGLDSLRASELRYRIETELGAVAPESQLLDCMNLQELADLVQTATPAEAVRTGPLGGEYPQSYNQRSLWLTHQAAPHSAAYNIARALKIESEIDIPALQGAIRQVVARHSALRTTFASSESVPVQIVHESMNIDLRAIDAANWTDTEFGTVLEEDAQRPFSLETGPLFRCTLFQRSRTENVLLLCAHHIVADLRSLTLLFRELGSLYAGAGVPAARSQYADFTHWQADLVAGPEGQRLKEYWTRALASPQVLQLPGDHPLPAARSFRGSIHRFAIGETLSERAAIFARAHSTTVFCLVLAAFQILLRRLSGQDRITTGVPVAGRSRAAFADIIGYCVNVVLAQADFAGDPRVSEFLVETRRRLLGAMQHGDYPIELLAADLQAEHDSRETPLFQSMLAWQQAMDAWSPALALAIPGERVQLGPLDAEVLPVETRSAQRDLTLMIGEATGRLEGFLEYNTDLFEAESAARIMRYFETILESTISSPDLRVSEIGIIPEPDKAEILYKWNATERRFEDRVTIHQLFEQQAAVSPRAPAVEFQGTQISYEELNRRANQIARHLHQNAIRPGSFVGIYLERSLEMVSAVLGVLKAGAAYVPIDVSHPPARVQWILESLGATAVLTLNSHLEELFRSSAASLRTVACLDGSDAEAASRPGVRITTRAQLETLDGQNPAYRCAPDDLAYIIFTSGSTGTPKGVMVQHRPVVNLIDWANRTFAVSAADRLLFVSALSFDLSVYDIFGILAAGGTIRVASAQEVRDPRLLALALAGDRITFWDSAPAALQHIVPALQQTRIDGPSLRLVFLSGDWAPLKLPGKIREFFPGAAVIALGGATEATVWSNYFPVVEVDPEWPSIPYGKPIQNARYHVLDARLNPCAIGVAGDLYIGGDCLSCGYIGAPELTARKYIPDPFGTVAGARLYSTGDLARYKADGNIEFLGRTDGQVKLRGFRIETGEIEAALVEHPSVQSCVVLAAGTGPDRQRLAAYIVPAGNPPHPSEFRAFLLKRLPEYMVPSFFAMLPEIPLTRNGKVDRAALPQPHAASMIADCDYVAPQTPVEQRLAAIFAELLEVERVGVRDNFFALGGHSLLLTKAASAIQAEFAIELPMAVFFQSPTVEAVAARIVEAQARQNPEYATELLGRLEKISDEEVAQLLAEMSGNAQAEPDRAATTISEIREAGDKRSISAIVRRYPLSERSVLVTDADGKPHVVDRSLLDLIDSNAPIESSERLHQALAEGLVVTQRDLARRLVARQTAKRAGRIGKVAYVTCNRPALLRSRLTGYIENCRKWQRDAEFVIADDTSDPGLQSDCLQALEEVSRRCGIQLFYAGRNERQRYAGELQKESGAPPEVVKFAIGGEGYGLPTIGANRNGLLLDTAGELLLTLDDDTDCRIGALPTEAKDLSFVSRHYAPELFPCANQKQAFDCVTFVDEDLLALHERVLGRSVPDLSSQYGEQNCRFIDPGAEFVPLLWQGDARVAVTLNGYIGDCGWGSPVNYLLMEGNSLDRLIASEAGYRFACRSRNSVQMAPGLTISNKADYAMMAFAGLDNRELLPPFLPTGRGEDNLMAAILTRCFPGACVAHLPRGLVHAPLEPRSFWPGEIARSGSGIDAGFLFNSCIRSAPGDPKHDGAAALRRLGRYLLDLASLPARDFQQSILDSVRTAASQLINRLSVVLESRGGAPDFWARDLQRFIGLAQNSMLRPEYAIPLELQYGRDSQTAVSATQRLIQQFGASLFHWPDIYQAAATLRQRGVRVARPI